MTVNEKAELISAKAYCNVLALQKGLDPAGHAGNFEDAILVESPLPWKAGLYEKAGTLPQAMIDLRALWLERYRQGHGYPHRSLLIAPDAAYSRAGFRRVMFYTRPVGLFARYAKIEYSVPEDELGPLLWALYEARDDLRRFDAYRGDPGADDTRDLLVCTHGTVDAACAKFGFPLYRHLRTHFASERLRVWRVSHFGGHVYAPTLIDMPTGHYWAYVEPPQAEQIVRRDRDVRALRGHYRGWAGLESGFLQAAECELWQRHGWAWLDYCKSGVVLAQDADEEHPAWAEVEITYTDGATSGIYRARVTVDNHVETIGTTGEAETYRFPQYVVGALKR